MNGPQEIVLDHPIDARLRRRAAAAAARHAGDTAHGRNERAVAIGIAALVLIGAYGFAETMDRLWWPVLLLTAGTAGGMWLQVGRQALLARAAFDTAHRKVFPDGRAQPWLGPWGWTLETPALSARESWTTLSAPVDYDGGLALVRGLAAHPVPDSALPEALDRAGLRTRIEAWREAGT